MKNPFVKLVPEAVDGTRKLENIMMQEFRTEPTIVGKAVGQLNKALVSLKATEATLETEIAERTERLRQAQLTIRAYERAMAEFAAEDALTTDERALVGETISGMMAAAVATELKT